MKPRQLIETLEDPSKPALTEHDEGGTLLLVLLAHMYYADGAVDAGELEQLARVTGVTGDALTTRLAELKARPLALERLADLYPEPEDRDDIITLAEHAVWGDDDVDTKEWDLMDELVEALNVHRD